eukprot:TRINITY_DN6537_c0_g1_i1.p1 TRINITY_DN6537_c0_g1~~TRINITY_DN6537_c0_g1_i1.p1  ORF type:complete len:504 (+),score=6.33 TRINITY_DN6537_c0_g1_i1:56-1567(+)
MCNIVTLSSFTQPYCSGTFPDNRSCDASAFVPLRRPCSEGCDWPCAANFIPYARHFFSCRNILHSHRFCQISRKASAQSRLKTPGGVNRIMWKQLTTGLLLLLFLSGFFQRSSSTFQEAAGGIVHYQAYQVAEDEFRAIGLSLSSSRDTRQPGSCHWASLGGAASKVVGTLTVEYPGQVTGNAYEAFVAVCKLAQPILISAGGTLKVTINGGEAEVYKVAPGKEKDWKEPVAPFLYFLSCCSVPLQGGLVATSVIEWVLYHHHLHSVEFFDLYNAGGIDDTLHGLLNPHVDEGILRITDIRDHDKFESYGATQLLVMHDCALRSFATSKWVLMTDMDEYVYVHERPHSIFSVLGWMDGYAWVSMGLIDFEFGVCKPVDEGSDMWAIEKLIYRKPNHTCSDVSPFARRELCLASSGSRKLCINPRAVHMLTTHEVIDAKGPGLNAHVATIRLNRYKGLGKISSGEVCKQTISPRDSPPEGLVKDHRFLRSVRGARLKGGIGAQV